MDFLFFLPPLPLWGMEYALDHFKKLICYEINKYDNNNNEKENETKTPSSKFICLIPYFLYTGIDNSY